MNPDIGRYYSVDSFGDMINSELRMEAFLGALREAITPGCTVLDIGTGPGVFAMMACKYGAGKVIAVDPNPAIEVGRKAARANGLSDKIEFVEGLSTDLELETPADVIISDLRGVLPFYSYHLPSIIDARERLLAPGGSLIPRRDVLRVALVEESALDHPIDRPWLENPFDLDLSMGHIHSINGWQRRALGPEAMLSDPADLLEIDYRKITGPDVSGRVRLPVARAGRIAGYQIWFDMDLAPGFGLTNAPGTDQLIYRRSFFPLERAVDLSAGDSVEIDFSANFRDGDYHYYWDTQVSRQGAAAPEIAYRQASVLGPVISLDMLKRPAESALVGIRSRGTAARYCIEQLEQQKPYGSIATELQNQYRDQFESHEQASDFVARLRAVLE